MSKQLCFYFNQRSFFNCVMHMSIKYLISFVIMKSITKDSLPTIWNSSGPCTWRCRGTILYQKLGSSKWGPQWRYQSSWWIWLDWDWIFTPTCIWCMNMTSLSMSTLNFLSTQSSLQSTYHLTFSFNPQIWFGQILMSHVNFGYFLAWQGKYVHKLSKYS